MNWVAPPTEMLAGADKAAVAFVIICVICLITAQDAWRGSRDSQNMPS